jgi:hypothetical protein
VRYLSETGIIELRNELKKFYSKLHTNMKVQQKFYDQEITLPKQLKGVEPHIPPTARTIINTGVDTLMQLDHLVSVLLWRDTRAAKETAMKLRMFDKAYLSNISKNSRYNLRRVCTKHALLYGEYFLKGPVYVPRMKPERNPGETGSDYRQRCNIWEDTLDKTFPFVHRAVHPLNVLPDPDVEPGFIIEDYWRQASEVKRAWPDWEGIPDTGYVRWTAYYSPCQKVYFIGDQVKLSADNAYSFIPYEMGNAGLGNEDDQGSPDKAIVGILAPALKTLKTDITLRTTVLYGLQFAVWGKHIISALPGTAGTYKPSNIPGEDSVIADAYNRREEPAQQLSPESYRILGMLDQDIQQIMPKTNWGSLPKGMTSGSMFYTSIIQGRQALEELKSQWEISASNMCNKLHLLLKYLVQEPVGIVGTLATGGKSILKLSPGQLHPDVQVTSVMLDPMTPEERQQRINLGVLLWRSGAASEETITENYFGLDYGIERNRKLVEAILKNPLVQNQLAQAALDQAGLAEVFGFLREQGFQINDQEGAADIRRATAGQQELPRFSDYNNKQLNAGTGSYEIPHREIYGQAPQPGEGFE